MSPEQPTPRKPPSQIPSDMNAFNRKVIDDFRANRGHLTGPLAGRTLMLLTTTGAKSGKERIAVLGFGKDGDRYVVIASGNISSSNNPSPYLTPDPAKVPTRRPQRRARGGLWMNDE